MACFIGTNGSGKSTLLDALGFLCDSLREGVEAACDKPQRGGFENLRTQGEAGPIAFTLYFRGDEAERPITYELQVDGDGGVPYVAIERLLQGRKTGQVGAPFKFLDIKSGAGRVWAGEATAGDKRAAHSQVRLDDRGRLAIATLGQLKEHTRIARFRAYLEAWYLSYFVPDAAREKPPAGAQRWLDRRGSNVANVLQYFQREHKKDFEGILARVAAAIPGVRRIVPTPSPDNHLLMAFHIDGHRKPFFQASMSDGTLKMLAYAVLLADPQPRPFLGIEEPENGLHHQLHSDLARAFLDLTCAPKSATQALVTTHSPYIIDGLEPEHVWVMKMSPKGRSTVERVADMPSIKELVAEGIPLGNLWYSNHFDEVAVHVRSRV